MFRTVDREGFATALGNLAGEALTSGVPSDLEEVVIPRGGAILGQFGLRPSGLLPEFVVVRDDDLQDTYAWVSAYFNGLTPITQWCRVWRQSEFGRLDMAAEVGLGRRLGAWIGAIVGECLVQANYRLSLKEMPGSAALATSTFVAARGAAIWGDLLDIEDLSRRYDDLQQRYSVSRRTLTSRSLMPLWVVLADTPIVSRSTANPRLLDDLTELLDQISERGLEALKPIARQAAGDFNLPELWECAQGSQSQRVEAVDRLAQRLGDGPASPMRDALLGFGASLVDPGVAALPDLLRRHTDRMPMAPLWLGAFAGAWSPSKVLNDNQGLGRLILKSLEGRTDLNDRPTADIAYDELARWLGAPGSKRPAIRAMSSRNLNVEIIAGVVAPVSLVADSQDTVAAPRAVATVARQYGYARQAPRDDSPSDRVMREVLRRLDDLEAAMTGQGSMLSAMEAPQPQPKGGGRRGAKSKS